MSKQIRLSSGEVAIVDDEDFERIARHHWSMWRGKRNRGVYARTNIDTNGAGFMHTMITGFDQTDHINGDGLDNRRCNLRPATTSQNMANVGKYKRRDGTPMTSRWKGVVRRPDGKHWRARIRVRGKLLNIGDFRSEENAATAYNFAASEHFGEFARYNEAEPIFVE